MFAYSANQHARNGSGEHLCPAASSCTHCAVIRPGSVTVRLAVCAPVLLFLGGVEFLVTIILGVLTGQFH